MHQKVQQLKEKKRIIDQISSVFDVTFLSVSVTPPPSTLQTPNPPHPNPLSLPNAKFWHLKRFNLDVLDIIIISLSEEFHAV